MKHKEKQYLSGEDSASYDRIPKYCFKDIGSILDIGCMSGLNAILSRHRPHFVRAENNNSYLGVDILEYPKYYLQPIIASDLLDFETTKKFDLVLALHTIEHIPLKYWQQVFDKLKGLVSDNGYLVVSVPYNEKIGGTDSHSVFKITKQTFRRFFAGGKIQKQRRGYVYFREFRERRVWAIMRFVWRIIIKHKYRWTNKHELMLIWQNKKEE